MAYIREPMPAPFDWILGDWRIHRTIAGHATMTGTANAVLLPDGGALYSERVAVALASAKTLAGRCSYLHRRTEGGFEIRFAGTRRLFQSLQFRQQGNALFAEATHYCVMDRYDSEYLLRADDRFTVRHTVRGPRKNYVSTTEFVRC